MKKPVLIIIDGPMGVGKTSISKKLRDRLKNTALLSMDVIKKFLHDFHSAEKNKRNFAKFEITSMIAKAYLKKGISVIIEQSLADKTTINNLVKKSTPKGIKVFIFQLNAPLEERLKLVMKRDGKNKKLKEQMLNDNLSHAKNNFNNYTERFDTSKEKRETIIKKIILHINK